MRTIVVEYPPNFGDIAKAFPLANRPGVIFAYGGIIYNPSAIKIPIWILAHENIHLDQQGNTPALWWKNYIEDPSFRLREEIPAHKKEWQTFLETFPNRHDRRSYQSQIYHRLAGPLYGKMIDKHRAKELFPFRSTRIQPWLVPVWR